MNTIEYYNKNAKAYFDKTISADMKKQYKMFLKYVKENGRILDFGCGSGRDSLEFKKMGYDVYPIDGSEELCKLAREYTGLDVRCMDFSDLSDKDFYDGIWACSSILHVQREKMLDVLIKIRDALTLDGCFFTSFKNGNDQESYLNDGRYFNGFSTESFSELSDKAGLEIVKSNINRSSVSAHNAVDHEVIIWNSYVLKRKM